MGLRQVIVVGACGLAVVGCGGGSESSGTSSGDGGSAGDNSGSDKASFVNNVNRYCADFAEIARLGDQSQNSGDLQAAARATAQYAQKAEQLADNLSQLTPPAGTQEAWNRFVEDIRTQARTEGDIIEAVQNRDAQRLQQLGPELQSNQAEFIAAGRALGDAGIAPGCLGG